MKKIVVIGGGTGNFMVLSGLKNYPVDITAVVNMADDGGSTGVLRDEIGVLPPGDVRQCLVALSESSDTMRNLFNYRFDRGSLDGHSFGNFFLSALEKTTGSFENAVEEASHILAIKGRVLPVTYEKMDLCVDLGDGKIVEGETNVDKAHLYKYPKKRLFIKPKAKINPKVEKAINEAELVVVSPGSLYSSLIPNFLVEGMDKVIQSTQAKILYICNLVNKPHETKNYMLDDYIFELEGAMGRKIDFALFNNKKPDKKLLEKYSKRNEILVKDKNKRSTYRLIEKNLLLDDYTKINKGKEFFIRHDPRKVSENIIKIMEEG